MKRLSIALVAALAVSGCASLAPYGPRSGPNAQGYAEQRIESNRWRVSYRGVGEQGPVADYALVRAAELTLENGHDWFEVTNGWVDGRPDSAGGIRPVVTVGGGAGRWGGYHRSGLGVGLSFDIDPPSPVLAEIEIVTGAGEAPDGPDVYYARAVLRNLRGR